MASFQAIFVRYVLRLINYKAHFLNQEALEKEIKVRRAKNYDLPPYFKKRFEVTEVAGKYKTYRIKNREMTPKHSFFYLHGGAYVFDIAAVHWSMLNYWMKELDCEIIVPLYPLAPESTYKEVLEFLYPLAENFVRGKNASFIGDSAGGGLCLTLAQILKKNSTPQPKHLFLLSPWLDTALRNPEIPDYEDVDPILGQKGLQIAGQMYAGNLDLTDARVNPIEADLEGLAPISLFIGTHDLLLPDCRKFKKLMEEKKISFNYYEYEKLFHDWMAVVSLPESRDVVKKIKELLS